MTATKSLGIFTIVLVAALSMTMFGCSSEDTESTTHQNGNMNYTLEDTDVTQFEEINENYEPLEPTSEAIKEYLESDAIITAGGEEGALELAKKCLEAEPLSRERLYKTLDDGGFTEEEAEYAVENCGADWNEQAALKAKMYLEVYDYSRESIVGKLIQCEFTEEQAEYGATAAGL